MLLASTLVLLLAAATPEERCPMPASREANQLTRGHHGCDGLAFRLRVVADSCFHNGRYVSSSGCAAAVAECERASATIKADERPYHDNAPYLGDIRGGWLGRSYGVTRQRVLGSSDPEYSCTSRDEARIRRASVERGEMGARHRDVRDEWIAWYRWAQSVALECRAQESARAAEEERKKREEEERRAQEQRKREEEERARAEAEKQKLEEERRAAAEKKKLEEEERRAEEQRRRAEEERVRREQERQARAAAAAERHGRQKADVDRMHGDLAAGLGSLEGSARFVSGIARSAHLRFGGGVGVTPIYADNYMGGTFNSSTDTSGMGLGPYARIDLFPIYGRVLGVGAYLETMMGGAATGTATSYFLHYALGARLFFGRDDVVALQLDLGKGGRTGSWDAYDEFSDLETLGAGSADFSVFGIGGHLCFEAADDKCAVAGYVRIGRETLAGMKEPVNVVRIGINNRGSYEAFVEWSTEYPRMGEPTRRIAETTGTHLQVVWSHAWDNFGSW